MQLPKGEGHLRAFGVIVVYCHSVVLHSSSGHFYDKAHFMSRLSDQLGSTRSDAEILKGTSHGQLEKKPGVKIKSRETAIRQRIQQTYIIYLSFEQLGLKHWQLSQAM